MSPVYPVSLTQLEAKVLWMQTYGTLETPVDGIRGNGPLEEALITGAKKLQDASHRYFTPSPELAHGH